MKKLIVFDVNETLLDLEALDPHFERAFGNAAVRKTWFATVLRNSLVATITGQYADFGQIAGASLDMTAQQDMVDLSDVDRAAILGTIRNLPAHADVRPGLEKLKAAIHAYYQIMGDIDDSILLLYRESQSLDQAGRRMIMRREEDVRRIFEEALAQGMEEGIFRVENPKLIAHDILVLGQMWGLKRWSLRKDLGLGEFTKLQMGLVLSGILAR